MANAFDPRALKELYELETSGENLVQDLVNIFTEDSVKLIDTIEASQSGNHTVLERASHTLKSSSRALGFNYLGDLCQAIEHAARAKSVDKASISKLRQSRSEAIAEIQAHAKTRAA